MMPAAVRGQLLALAFIHPVFAWWAVGAVLACGWESRPVRPAREPA